MDRTSFDRFSTQYDAANGDIGDYTHQHTIDPALFECIGDFEGFKIYDIACGNGYIARRLAKNGAAKVYASDISPGLIEIATTKYDNPSGKINYSVKDATDISGLPQDYFDLAFMSMAIHYIEDVSKFFKNINKLLKPNGRLVFTTNHPLANLGRSDLGSPGYDFEKALSRAKKYLEPHQEQTVNLWTGDKDVTIYRTSLSHMINQLVKNGFLIDKLIEPPTVSNYGTNSSASSKDGNSPIPIIYALGAVKVT